MGVPPPLVGTQGENSVAVDHCALNEGNCLQNCAGSLAFGMWGLEHELAIAHLTAAEVNPCIETVSAIPPLFA